MAETHVVSIPSGMLRISKEGETDRIIYPVHAEGWRSIGWTVHAPEPELEEVEEAEEESPGFVGDDDPYFPPPPADQTASAESAQAESAEADSAEDQASLEVEPVAAPEPLDFDRLTKAEIVAAVAERYGEHLDPGYTRAELLAAAEAIAALAAAGDDSAGASTPDAEADAAELEVPPLL